MNESSDREDCKELPPIHLVIREVRSVFGDMKDGSGTLISEHALRVSLALERLTASNSEFSEGEKLDLRRAALCHDILEDTTYGEEMLCKLIGAGAVKLVKELTLSFENKTIREAVAPMRNYSDEAFLIKLADIYDNVSKSIFLVSFNKPDFYESFFLPLLKEYQEIIKIRIEGLRRGAGICKLLSQEVFAQIENLNQTIAILKN